MMKKSSYKMYLLKCETVKKKWGEKERKGVRKEKQITEDGEKVQEGSLKHGMASRSPQINFSKF